MRFSALAVGLIPLAALASASDTSVRVTYTSRAARAVNVFKELSRLSGVDLQTIPLTENEVLVISVKDTPLSDVLSRIAVVTSGAWKQDGSVYRLIPDRSLRDKEERIEEAKRIADVRKAIEARLKPNQQTAATAKAGADTPVAPPLTTPEESAITKLLVGLDPAVLADVQAGERLVFSTEPTRTQRNLGGDAHEIINEFIQAHNLTAVNQTDGDNPALAGLSAEQAAAISSFTKHRTGKIGAASKALLIVTRLGFGVFNMTQLELRIYDQKGGVAFSASSMLTMPGQDIASLTASIVAAQQGKTPEATTIKETPIELSEDSKLFQKSTSGMAGGNFKLKINPDLKRKLFQPNVYDPLSYVTTDKLLALAKSKGKPFVAEVPDAVETGLSMYLAPTAMTVESFEKELQKGETMSIVPDEKFTVVKPSMPSQSRIDRLDRDALTTLLQSVEGKEIPSLSDVATYSLHAPDPMQGGLGQLYFTLFVPGGTQQSMEGVTNWEMLRFYANLSPDARSSLINGGKIEIASLTNPERTSLEKMVYGSLNQLSVQDPNQKSEDQPFWMKMIGGASGDDYRNEATEVVPNGLPGDGYVDLKMSSEPFASPIASGDSTNVASLGVLGPDELAIFKMFKEDKNYAQVSAMLPSFGQMQIGERSVMNFTFHLMPQVSLKQTLKDHHLAKDAPVVSENNLPDEFQRLIAARLEMFKKSPLGALGALMGGGAQAIHP